jgi:catechol 2,3-dioxygenase-like lactoylglutathione lyase family enzyme
VDGGLHHVELWVPDLERAAAPFGWLLTALGYRVHQDWPGGRSWKPDGPGPYLVLERSPDLSAPRHDRRAPGLNHLAFTVAGRDRLDALTAAAQQHGWRLMFADRHPHAGGPAHYAAYLENDDGFEVELVAEQPPVDG